MALAALLACSIAFVVFSVTPAVLTARGAWPFYAVIFVSGIARAFLQSARNALATELVPRALIPNAAAWRSSTWQTASVVGPALGGLLYGFTSATVAYSTDVVLMTLAVLSLLAVNYTQGPVSNKDESLYQSLRAGINFVFHETVILGALTLDLFSGTARRCRKHSLPVFAAEILKVGPQGLRRPCAPRRRLALY